MLLRVVRSGTGSLRGEIGALSTEMRAGFEIAHTDADLLDRAVQAL